MDLLGLRIRERIMREGPIPFEAFMQMALYHPGLGYYTSEEMEIGRAGDFYTSPHLHPLFGAMLGRQMEEMWDFMGRPGEFEVVEMGGGRGYLCKDMLDYLKGRDIFPGLSYTLVEINPRMAQRQKELLSDYTDKIKWTHSLAGLKEIRGCILSNELIDAMPVHLIETDGGLSEVYVTVEGDRFVETTGSPSTEGIAAYLREFSIELPRGYRTEVNLGMRGWLGEVSGALAEGFLLTIDYGYPAWEYYSEERTRGTLLCYHKHRLSENPYENIGRQDITSHVNFSALRKWGEQAGLGAVGFCRQGPYLVSLGIDELMADSGVMDRARVKGLIMPGAMGDTHKVMVQYRGKGRPELRGFGLKNQLKSL
jgi:SAM-dependent MidA family methyltransferase